MVIMNNQRDTLNYMLTWCLTKNMLNKHYHHHHHYIITIIITIIYVGHLGL